MSNDAPSQATLHTASYINVLLQQRLPENNNNASVYVEYINSTSDFQNHWATYHAMYRAPASSAHDFPTDDASLSLLAKRLTDAMVNMTQAVETGKKSVARISLLSPYEVVLKAWNLIFVMRDVQIGNLGMASWGTQWEYQSFDCYMDRFNSVCEKLQASKSLVSSLFDHDFTIRIAINPAAEYKKKMANFNNNKERAVRLIEAQSILKQMEDNEGLISSRGRASKRASTKSLKASDAIPSLNHNISLSTPLCHRGYPRATSIPRNIQTRRMKSSLSQQGAAFRPAIPAQRIFLPGQQQLMGSSSHISVSQRMPLPIQQHEESVIDPSTPCEEMDFIGLQKQRCPSAYPALASTHRIDSPVEQQGPHRNLGGTIFRNTALDMDCERGESGYTREISSSAYPSGAFTSAYIPDALYSADGPGIMYSAYIPEGLDGPQMNELPVMNRCDYRSNQNDYSGFEGVDLQPHDGVGEINPDLRAFESLDNGSLVIGDPNWVSQEPPSFINQQIEEIQQIEGDTTLEKILDPSFIFPTSNEELAYDYSNSYDPLSAAQANSTMTNNPYPDIWESSAEGEDAKES